MLHSARLSVLALALTAPAASSQILLDEFFGNQVVEQAGYSVAGGADFDGDGWDDVVIGSPFRNAGGKINNGAVRVVSGRDGSLLHHKIGDANADWFGWDVALAGDVDADGVQDVIVGAPNGELSGSGRPGMARVFSGASGVTLWTIYGIDDGELFGHAVGGGILHDADAHAEFAVGAPNAIYFGIEPRGYVRVFDGATGTQVGQSTSTYTDAQWGWSLFCRGDVDGDGTRDIVVGAPNGGSAQQGEVKVVSGASFLSVGFEWSGAATGDRFGSAVSCGMDLTADGRDEIVIGAPREGTNGVDAGWVGLYDAATGLLVDEWWGDAAGDDFGTSVTPIGDADGGGVRDLLVGAPQATSLDTGYARVFSTSSGLELYTLSGEDAGQMFGYDVAAARDVNDDGARDFVVGARLTQNAAGTLAGSARVYSGSGPGFAVYCTAGASASGCQPAIGGTGTPSASAASGFFLDVTGVEGSKSGIFFYGAGGRQASPWGNGSSFQCVTPPVKRGGLLPGIGTPGACDGAFVQDLNARWCPTCPKPSHNFGAGATVQAQLWYRDPLNTSNQTTSLSNAIEFLVAP